MAYRNEAITLLNAHDIKPSVQRIAIMEYLLQHRTHPVAEDIYDALCRKIPTLSKATVYNTLSLLTQKGVARQLTIDEQCTHYDGELGPHAHFLCNRCGKLYDISLRGKTAESAADIPTGFQVYTSELYLRGICPSCAQKDKNKD